MKASRFSEAQFAFVLKQADTGSIQDLAGSIAHLVRRLRRERLR